MIAELTKAIVKRIPNARITWWYDDTVGSWLFKVAVTEGTFRFGTFSCAVLPRLLNEKEQSLRTAHVEEISKTIHFEYQAERRKRLGGEVLLSTYAIYDHPTDYPTHYVVRRWDVVEGSRLPQPDTEAILCGSLEEARQLIQKLNPGAYLVDPNDPDPNIVEVWS